MKNLREKIIDDPIGAVYGVNGGIKLSRQLIESIWYGVKVVVGRVVQTEVQRHILDRCRGRMR
jgi:hypothetical protein